jgi:hypothetical protein
MRPWKRLFQESPEPFDLGDGFILKFVQHEPSIGIDWWTIKRDGSTAGGVKVFPENSNYGANVDFIRIENQYRNMGLGRKAVRALANHYGSLASSLEGETSKSAHRMWEVLGAKKVPSGNHKGFIYKLFRQKGNLS